jgi:hypothetical protein
MFSVSNETDEIRNILHTLRDQIFFMDMYKYNNIDHTCIRNRKFWFVSKYKQTDDAKTFGV